MFDPYKELGVNKKADTATIRKAYRKRARKTHPDSGGSKEDFAKTSLAQKILLDHDKRDKYDKTGKFDEETSVQDKDHGALSMIGNLVHAFLREDKDIPPNVDFIESMIKHINQIKNNQNVIISNANTAFKRLEKMRKRLRKKTGGRDHISSMFDFYEAGIKQSKANAKRTKEDCERAVEILKDYEFDVDKAMHAYTIITASTSTTT